HCPDLGEHRRRLAIGHERERAAEFRRGCLPPAARPMTGHRPGLQDRKANSMTGRSALPSRREGNASTSEDTEWEAKIYALLPPGLRGDRRPSQRGRFEEG